MNKDVSKMRMYLKYYKIKSVYLSVKYYRYMNHPTIALLNFVHSIL